ncbi:MAG TPA: SH3 domain-containing protein [Aggregatilineales bacterium]|nr:SH3 domain-containing protein [Anaerolineales bacterium]HRE46463.1 SH3 domain-containing protein [Aggregatilineales bacterium]
MHRLSRTFPILVLLAAILACNLMGAAGSSTPTPNAGETLSPNGAGRPLVLIEAPTNGSQGVLRQPLTVKVRATDTNGITRVVMREGGRVVVTLPSPNAQKEFSVLLPYTPMRTGNITLEVIAYSQTGDSPPVSLTLEIVGSVGELRNPASLDPTLGAASGQAVCTVKVNIDNLNMRRGAGTAYAIIVKLPLGEDLTVIGRNNDTTWLSVRRSNGMEGWVSAQYVNSTGDCTRAPITG